MYSDSNQVGSFEYMQHLSLYIHVNCHCFLQWRNTEPEEPSCNTRSISSCSRTSVRTNTISWRTRLVWVSETLFVVFRSRLWSHLDSWNQIWLAVASCRFFGNTLH